MPHIVLPHPAPADIYTLSLHDALPILWKTITSSMRLSSSGRKTRFSSPMTRSFMSSYERPLSSPIEKPSVWFFERSEEHTSELQSHVNLVCRLLLEKKKVHLFDRGRTA